MKKFLVFAVLALASNPCCSRAVEESVVSDYTPSASGPRNVYSQIAANLAERVTLPFFSFLGLNSSSTTTTRRPFQHIELQDPGNSTRDVEELSSEALQKTDQKPEKVTLFSSYLPSLIPLKETKDVENLREGKWYPEKPSSKFEIADGKINDTKNEVDSDDFDDDFEVDDVNDSSQRGPFVYVLELVGSIIQLLWGGFLALFKPSSRS